MGHFPSLKSPGKQPIKKRGIKRFSRRFQDRQNLPESCPEKTLGQPPPARVPRLSGKKGAHKLKKHPRDTGRVSLGHPVGQTGVKKRAFLPGHWPGVAVTPGHPGSFHSMPFSAP